MKKRFLLILSILGVGFLVWYFFVKEYDFKITFTAKQSSGIVYRFINDADYWKSSTIDSVTSTHHSYFNSFQQNYYIKDSVFSIDWEIAPLNDSTTSVTAYLKDKKHSFLQKLQVPFVRTPMVQRTVSSIKSIKKGLEFFQSQYRVSNVEESTLAGKHCLYISFKSSTQEKANDMIQGNGAMMNYLNSNKLTLDGYPFIQVTYWDPISGKLNFNFCFPIKQKDHKPTEKGLKTMVTEDVKGLRVVFNGNYRISDRSWYAILDYKDLHGIDIISLPTEIYYNDPHSGYNDIEWRTDVFMPIKTN